MVSDIRHRLTALEVLHYARKRNIEVWINEGDGLLRNRAGEVMTQAAFCAAFPNSRHITLNIFDEKT